MHLRQYLSQAGSLTVAVIRQRMNELGADVKDDAQIRQWAAPLKPGRPSRKPTPANCLYLERATYGKVSRQSTRPDDYQAIWPELSAPKTKQARVAA